MAHTVTGSCKTRLVELKKYALTGSLSVLYFTSNTPTVDGLDLSLTTTGVTQSTYVYYIGGITFVDTVVNGNTTTIFTFQSLGYDDINNFDDLPYIKDEAKQNIVDKPEVDNDVFIIRQSLSVFQNIYRLEDISNISEFEKYAGGAKFNIVKNT